MIKFVHCLEEAEIINKLLTERKTGNSKEFAYKLNMTVTTFFAHKRAFIELVHRDNPDVDVCWDDYHRTYRYSKDGTLQFFFPFKMDHEEKQDNKRQENKRQDNKKKSNKKKNTTKK